MGEVLWSPSGARTRLDEFADSVRDNGGPGFDSYEEMWRWSVDDLESFWSAVWTFFDVPSDGDPAPALASDAMPGAACPPYRKMPGRTASAAYSGQRTAAALFDAWTIRFSRDTGS